MRALLCNENEFTIEVIIFAPGKDNCAAEEYRFIWYHLFAHKLGNILKKMDVTLVEYHHNTYSNNYDYLRDDF